MHVLNQETINAIGSITSRCEEHDGAFPFLNFLAGSRFKRTITIYDLETTSLLNHPNFGITELAMLHIIPGDGVYSTVTFCNPCRPILREVAKKTGITDDMVRDAPLWEELGGPLFHQMACDGNIMIGFNNFTFDRRCVVQANRIRRFNGSTPAEDNEFDTFNAASLFMGRAPKLGDVARALGIVPNGQLHRALTDVFVTAAVADRLGQEYGLLSLKRKSARQLAWINRDTPQQTSTSQPQQQDSRPYPQQRRPASGGKEQMFQLARSFLAGEGPKKTDELENYLRSNSTDPGVAKNPGFFIGECIDTGVIKLNSLKFDEARINKAVSILSVEGIEKAWATNWTKGKLKPLFELVKPVIQNFDYIMLRETLARMGVPWSTLKVGLQVVSGRAQQQVLFAEDRFAEKSANSNTRPAP